MDLKKNLTRIVAVVALAAATIAVIVVVVSSFPDSSDDDGAKGGARKERAEGSGEKFYTVQPGDSFSVIAEKEGIDQEKLELLNPDLDPQALAPGQQVRLR